MKISIAILIFFIAHKAYSHLNSEHSPPLCATVVSSYPQDLVDPNAAVALMSLPDGHYRARERLTAFPNQQQLKSVFAKVLQRPSQIVIHILESEDLGLFTGEKYRIFYAIEKQAKRRFPGIRVYIDYIATTVWSGEPPKSPDALHVFFTTFESFNKSDAFWKRQPKFSFTTKDRQIGWVHYHVNDEESSPFKPIVVTPLPEAEIASEVKEMVSVVNFDLPSTRQRLKDENKFSSPPPQNPDLRMLYDASPEAYQLAVLLSMSISPNISLVRELRIGLFPWAPVSAEAYLWTPNDLFDGYSNSTIPRSPEIRRMIQMELKEHPLLDRAWEIIYRTRTGLEWNDRDRTEITNRLTLIEEIVYWSVKGTPEENSSDFRRINRWMFQFAAHFQEQPDSPTSNEIKALYKTVARNNYLDWVKVLPGWKALEVVVGKGVERASN